MVLSAQAFLSSALVVQSVTSHFTLVLLLQDNLLLYNHAKLMAEDNHSSGKEYLVSIMFSHYDQNNNGALEREELEQVCSQAAVCLPVFMFHLQKLQNYSVDLHAFTIWGIFTRNCQVNFILVYTNPM
jgi:hypothetical protein